MIQPRDTVSHGVMSVIVVYSIRTNEPTAQIIWSPVAHPPYIHSVLKGLLCNKYLRCDLNWKAAPVNRLLSLNSCHNICAQMPHSVAVSIHWPANWCPQMQVSLVQYFLSLKVKMRLGNNAIRSLTYFSVLNCCYYTVRTLCLHRIWICSLISKREHLIK